MYELIVEGKVVDEITNTTGFQNISFDSQEGLFVNGDPILQNGGYYTITVY